MKRCGSRARHGVAPRVAWFREHGVRNASSVTSDVLLRVGRHRCGQAGFCAALFQVEVTESLRRTATPCGFSALMGDGLAMNGMAVRS
eukprot:39021-Prymnesium_polylepis.1